MGFKIFDFGGSFIKIYCSNTKKITRIPMFEDKIVELNKLKNIIIDNLDNDVDFVAFSCQMHGMVLFMENSVRSEFITWKNSSPENILENNYFNEFHKTGLKKRSDLPINNLNYYLKQNNIINQKIYFKNISEALLDDSNNLTHSTMACGSGFYNIFEKEYIEEYKSYFKNKYNIDLIFDNVTNEYCKSGFINYKDKKIPVMIGIGDFQGSLNGIGLGNNSLVINMATGSQIAKIVNLNEINNIELYSYRPYFNNKYLQCFTHIPSGRFLNIFYNFFKELNVDLWEIFLNLNINDVENSDLKISTNIFHPDGILINNIKENFNFKNLCASIIKNYTKQYVDLIKNNFDLSSVNCILLSGGIPKKIGVIREIFEIALGKEIRYSDIDDDSLMGIIKLIEKK